MEPRETVRQTVRPVYQDFPALRFRETLEVLRNVGKERHQRTFICPGKKNVDAVVDEIGAVNREKVFMSQSPQRPDLVQDLCFLEKVRSTADFDLCTQVHTAYRTG